MIRFSCPTCAKGLKVDAKYAGRKVACPKCGEKLRVPAAAEPKPAPAAEPEPEPPPAPPVPEPAPEPPPGAKGSIDDLFDEEFGEESPPEVPEPKAAEPPPEDPPAADLPADEVSDSPAADEKPPEPPEGFESSPVDPVAAARVGSREKKRPNFTPELSAEEHEAWEKYIEDERRKRHKPAEDELDMTPMVDVTFLLLIFFMVTVSFQLQKSMQAEPPESEQEAAASASTEEEPEEEPIVVEVTAKNELFVDGRKVPLPEVGEAIAELKAAEPRLELKLEVDRAALHGTVVRVLDAAAAAGVTGVKRSSVGG